MCGSYCIAAASPLAGIGVRCTFVFGGWDSSHRTFLGLSLSSFRPADFRRSGLRLRGGTNSHGRCRRRWLSSLVSASVRTFTLPGRSPEAARFLSGSPTSRTRRRASERTASWPRLLTPC